MAVENANIEWYIAHSHALHLKPRCPLAHAELCPRYYTSILLLATSKITTPIPDETKSRLDKRWQRLQPTLSEEDASVQCYPKSNLSGVSQFCPEVSYEIFGEFVSHFLDFPDAVDRNTRHKELTNEKVNRTDLRWRWLSHSHRHYSECKEFSVFANLSGFKGCNPKSRSSRTRSSLSPVIRWQVFARDSFTCQYCGRRPPIVLEVDHRTSIANGGDDDIDNLVTSCADCNRGKGRRNG